MLISVCVKAKDLTQALHAADMFRSTGRKLDTILYTNLIGGQPLRNPFLYHGAYLLHSAMV